MQSRQLLAQSLALGSDKEGRLCQALSQALDPLMRPTRQVLASPPS